MICALTGTLAAAGFGRQARPTSVVHFAVPAHLPERTVNGSCEPSRAAWFRDDAALCASGGKTYDPCFLTATSQQWLCVTDPRKPDEVIRLLGPAPSTKSETARGAAHRAWFFELADGSTCRPLPTRGREVDGLTELYSCRFGTDGEADAVLGDFDTSQPVWTVRKVLINKKTDP